MELVRLFHHFQVKRRGALAGPFSTAQMKL